MRTHTANYKNAIKELGRQIDVKITYQLNGQTIELGAEDLNSITPHYEGTILKSVMRQVDLDSNVDIPLETVFNLQFGLKVGNSYEYINLGNFVVYESKKQEDTNSYSITCYDKMLYAMKDYQDMNLTYPITVRNYISAICTELGLTFKNASDTFVNYNVEIEAERYLETDGKSLGYTFRDVLDELAQVTASTICINEDDDELEIRYITETNDTIDEEYLKDINVSFGKQYGAVNTIVLSRSGGTDKIYASYPSDLPEADRISIEISNNQIMNFNDRDNFIQGILNQLKGLQYYINDFVSTGITYYDLCDRYSVQVGNNTYSCVMLNNEININQGLEEMIYTDEPSEAIVDYTKADKTDRRLNQTTLIVDKQNQIISAMASDVEDDKEKVAQMELTVDGISSTVSNKVGKDEIISSINQSAEQVSISANKVNLSGYVTFSNLSTSGDTAINGDNLTTGSIKSSNYVANTSGTLLNLTNGKFFVNSTIAEDNGGEIYIRGSDNDIYLNKSGIYMVERGIYSTGDAKIRMWLTGDYPYLYMASKDNITDECTFAVVNIPSLTPNMFYVRGYYIDFGTELKYQGGNVYGIHTLYDNSSGTTGTVTLIYSSADYDYVELFYYIVGTTYNYYGSTKIESPNGKIAILQGQEMADGTNYNYRAKNVSISGTSITNSSYGVATINTSGQCAATQSNNIYITKVVGYKK